MPVYSKFHKARKMYGRGCDHKMEKLRIFVVEDESIILRSFCMVIEKMGNELAGKAVDGISAIEKIKKAEPDMVLVDINIPGKDGLSVVREACLEKMIPTIVITGHISDELVSRANCKCVFGYLMKPISGEELQAAIRIAWGRYESFLMERERADEFEIKLETRKIVEQAKGIMMEEFCLTESEAMRRLQKMASTRRTDLRSVAQDVIRSKHNLGL